MITRFIIALTIIALPQAAVSGVDSGEALYGQHCEHCHGGYVSKAPQSSLLQIMSPSSIYRAMSEGVMREQARDLKSAQRQLIAEYLTGQPLIDAASAPLPTACDSSPTGVTGGASKALTGWGVDLGNRRFQGPDHTQMRLADLPRLKLKWSFAYPDAVRARSQPLVLGNTVYVGAQNGSVFALDRETGCLRWQFETVAEVRTAIVAGDQAFSTDMLLYFGDLVGNVYAIEAATGKLVWRDRPDDHPSLTLTAAPALHEGLLYVPLSALEVTAAADPNYACCTFRGGVAVYNAITGARVWTGYTIDRPPVEVGKNAVGTPRIAPSGAPIWNTPALDVKRQVMYVGTGENYSSPANETSDAIIALSMKDGSIVWSQQMTPGDAWNMGCETEEKLNCPPENGPDYDFGAATILASNSAGRDIVLAGQKSGHVYAMDPENGGEVLWHQKLGRGGIQGGVHFGMAVDGDILYVPMSDFDGGPRWPGVAKPGMYALDITSGVVKWYTPARDVCDGREFCQPGLSAPATAIAGGVVGGAMDGHLRGYDKDTGKVVWDFDTAQMYATINGIEARGGSIGGGSGPVFHGDMLFVNSGYGIYFHMPGNVLLAFELEP